jgi:glucose/arabinose dehydrogenase
VLSPVPKERGPALVGLASVVLLVVIVALGIAGGGKERPRVEGGFSSLAPGDGSREADRPGSGREGSRPADAPRLRLKPVANFARPLFLTQPREDRTRLFVVEKGGRVRIVRDGKVLKEPFLSVRGRVSDLTEQGLLGLAFAPSFSRTRLLYIAFTDRAGDLRVEEWRASRANPDRAPHSSRRLVLRVPQPRPTHNGGNLVFGPDGLLYVGVGDGGGPGDPRRAGQDRGTMLGKILRIDPRQTGKRRYRVPTTNPFVRLKGARREIYAYGVRNPWRFSFDRETGAFVMGDVGQEAFEELNYRPRGRLAGANFGWSAFEGNRRFNPRIRARRHVRPMHTYGRDRGCSVIGGPVVRDPGLPSLHGRMLYSDFCSGQISSIVPRAPRGRLPRREGLKVSLAASFGEDSAGRIYVVSLDGPVYRLVEG